MVRPTDLPDFGTITGTFVESEDSEAGIIIPKVDGSSPLEDLETPDQLEERQKKVVTPRKKRTKKRTKKVAKKVVKKKEGINLNNVLSRHPDWEPNMEFQYEMFKDMLMVAGHESEQVQKRMNALECFIENYPLMASTDELNEMRELMKRNVELAQEKLELTNMVLIINNTLNPPEPEPEPEPEKGFFAKVKELF